MKITGGKRASRYPTSPHGGSCFEVVEEYEELDCEARLSDNEFNPSPRSVLGVNSNNESKQVYTDLIDPVQIFRRLRQAEDLVPRIE